MTVQRTIERSDLSALKETFEGRVLSPAEEGYDRARKVWNAMIDRRPSVVLQCASTADVVRVVRSRVNSTS